MKKTLAGHDRGRAAYSSRCLFSRHYRRLETLGIESCIDPCAGQIEVSETGAIGFHTPLRRACGRRYATAGRVDVRTQHLRIDTLRSDPVLGIDQDVPVEVGLSGVGPKFAGFVLKPRDCEGANIAIDFVARRGTAISLRREDIAKVMERSRPRRGPTLAGQNLRHIGPDL